MTTTETKETHSLEVSSDEARCVTPAGDLTHDPNTCHGPYCRLQYPTSHDQG